MRAIFIIIFKKKNLKKCEGIGLELGVAIL